MVTALVTAGSAEASGTVPATANRITAAGAETPGGAALAARMAARSVPGPELARLVTVSVVAVGLGGAGAMAGTLARAAPASTGPASTAPPSTVPATSAVSRADMANPDIISLLSEA